jgi:hypothetical protein
MEADWEFDLGADSPAIEGSWAGWIDLRTQPGEAFNLPETAGFLPLAKALQRLNAADSPVWTAKCDWYPELERDEFDADELDAPSAAASGMACYIDLLPSSAGSWIDPARLERSCRSLCSSLRSIPLRCCRVDLVIRRAHLESQPDELGITAYLTGCGPDRDAAASALAAVLQAFTSVLSAAALP